MAAPPFRVAKDPAPAWQDLLRPVRDHAGQSKANLKNRYLFARGRQAIYFALRALSLQPGDVVLVPSFVCNSVTSPILAAGCHVAYYRVGRDCSLDLADIELRILAGARALLVVHFFGFPTAIEESRQLAARYKIPLIEDCAHLPVNFLEDGGMGSYGDATVYSWRKSLPIEDGAELILHSSSTPLTLQLKREGLLQILKGAWHLCERIAAARRLAKNQKTEPSHPVRARNAPASQTQNAETERSPLEGAEEIFTPTQSRKAMSLISRLIFSHLDIGNCTARRRANYLYLQAKLANVKGTTVLHAALLPASCPLFFPMFFEGCPNAHHALRARGIPAVTWGDVRPPDLPLSKFLDAAFLYDNLVLLPIHQSLTQWELDAIAEAVIAVRDEHAFAIRLELHAELSRANAPLLTSSVKP